MKKKVTAIISAVGAFILSYIANVPEGIPFIGQLHYVIGMSIVVAVLFAILAILNIALRYFR